jgi:hypothetical protein
MPVDVSGDCVGHYASNLIFTVTEEDENAEEDEEQEDGYVPQLPPDPCDEMQHSGVTEWMQSDNQQGACAYITVLMNSDDEYDESTGSLHNAGSQNYVDDLVFDTDEDSASSMTQKAAALPPMADAASDSEDGYLPVFGGAANAGTEVEEMHSGGSYCLANLSCQM